jgi:hypothetical protein
MVLEKDGLNYCWNYELEEFAGDDRRVFSSIFFNSVDLIYLM